MYERSRNLMECHLSGFTYYDGLDVIENIKVGAFVSLRSEPDNPYDANAVAVFFEDTKLGYVPQAKNDLVSNLLYFGHGSIVEARISCFNPEAHPGSQLRVVVKLKDNRE